MKFKIHVPHKWDMSNITQNVLFFDFFYHYSILSITEGHQIKQGGGEELYIILNFLPNAAIFL